MNDDLESQHDEILALKSIYEENGVLEFDEVSRKGRFNVRINAVQPFKLNFSKGLSCLLNFH